ncbi:pilus assembly protein TadG-related protein [Paenarthrobacter ilicis]|uniref:Putative Flp pilus-assembly TadG-like N-terminal domain-containing protein n=1 Tax=Paenarthrobacter ilicis TaxID=43665 RepID=A0ABX0TEN1_9MICC|nr:pilus assembly protein TadG-related protein [Paenarthrobacter ilicis]MBM7793733.1 hypothetical protein [Paenarthrobacter ilicis]NII99912.1 hypothetical protein [Paenarthrobacter ilicis]
MNANRRRSDPREEGQLTVLIIGFVALSLLVVAAVTAVSSVYLEHKKLLSLADGAALAAADSFVAGDLGRGTAPAAALEDRRVLAAVTAYLEQGDAQGHDHLSVAPGTGSGPGGTAVVVLTAVAHPPLTGFFLPEGIVVEAQSTARARLIQ